MILDIQIKIFGTGRRMRIKVFILKKILGGLSIIIFLWKSVWSFLLH